MATAPVTRCTVVALSLGTQITLHGWSGWVSSLQAQIDRYLRQGATGSGAQQTATVARAVGISAWRIEDDPSVAIGNIGQWEGYEGQVCKIVDPWGRTIPRARLTECMAGPPRIGKGPLAESGAQGIYLVSYSAMIERLPDNSS